MICPCEGNDWVNLLAPCFAPAGGGMVEQTTCCHSCPMASCSQVLLEGPQQHDSEALCFSRRLQALPLFAKLCSWKLWQQCFGCHPVATRSHQLALARALTLLSLRDHSRKDSMLDLSKEKTSSTDLEELSAVCWRDLFAHWRAA